MKVKEMIKHLSYFQNQEAELQLKDWQCNSYTPTYFFSFDGLNYIVVINKDEVK